MNMGGYQRGYDDAMAQRDSNPRLPTRKRPKVLAVVEQMVDPEEIQHLIAGATQIYFGVPTIPRPNEVPVTVTITERVDKER